MTILRLKTYTTWPNVCQYIQKHKKLKENSPANCCYKVTHNYMTLYDLLLLWIANHVKLEVDIHMKFTVFFTISSIRITRKSWHTLLNTSFHIAMTSAVFAGGITLTGYPVVCQAVSPHFSYIIIMFYFLKMKIKKMKILSLFTLL